MKKLITLMLVAILIFSFAACGQKNTAGTASEQTGEEISDSADTSIGDEIPDISEEALDDAMSLLTDSDHKKWPKDIVHPDMPEYKKGQLNGWNQWNNDDPDSIFMLIKDTSKEDLEEYKSELDAAGFTVVNGDTYHKDLYDVEFQFNGDTILQISSSKTKVAAWPKLLDFVPEIKKGSLSSIIEPSDDMPGYIQLYYINMTQADLDEWYADLSAKGFTVDNNSVTMNNPTFNGKSYQSLYVQCQENGTNEWMIDFMFE